MAPPRSPADFCDPKKIEKICSHCNKKVENSVKCIKCCENYHPACLRQSASRRSAVCVHEAENSENITSDGGDAEKVLLRALVDEIQDKNKILQENIVLLKEKIILLEDELRKQGNSQKGNKKCPRNSDIPKSAVPAIREEDSPEDSAGLRLVATTMRDESSSSNEFAANSINMTQDSKEVEEENLGSRTNTLTSDLGNINNNNDDNDNKWQEVKHKTRKRMPSQKTSRPVPIKGSSTAETILATAQNKAWVFVSGFDPKITATDILCYLKSQNFEHCICEKMVTKKDKYKISFKLGVPPNDKEKVMSPDLWPEGIIINHFLNLQRLTRQQVPQTRNAQHQ